MKRAMLICAIIGLSGCGRDKSAEEWVGQLQDSNPAARLEAVNALAKKTADPGPTVSALAAALKDANSFVRRDAARALGKIGSEAAPAVPLLSLALRDRERSVRRAAADALKKIDPALAARTARVRR
jgi:HEAT repeat protein